MTESADLKNRTSDAAVIEALGNMKALGLDEAALLGMTRWFLNLAAATPAAWEEALARWRQFRDATEGLPPVTLLGASETVEQAARAILGAAELADSVLAMIAAQLAQEQARRDQAQAEADAIMAAGGKMN